MHALTFAYTPQATLEERAHRDRAPYDVWAAQGQLIALPGASVDFRLVARHINTIIAGMNIVATGVDRHLLDAFSMAAEIEDLQLALIEIAQNYSGMSPCIDVLEGLLIGAMMRHGAHPVLTACAANAVVKLNAGGQRMLDKHKSYGRIDALVALAMAVGVKSVAPRQGGASFWESPGLAGLV